MSLPTYKQNDGKGNDSGFVPPGQQKAKKQRADLQYLLMAKGGGGGNSGGNSGGNGSGTGTDKDNNDGKGSGVENDNKEKWVEKEKDLNSKGYKGKGKYENRGKHLGWYKNGKYGDQLNPELIETTYYLNDVADPLTQVLMTYDDNDNYKAAYAYGLERFEVQALDSTRPESQDPLYYLYDGLGSVAQLTRPNGEVRDHYRYDEYGVPAPGAKLSEDGRNVNHNSFGYTGELWDEEDDLLYLRSRYYAPKTGRFMTRDAFPGFAANPLSMHKYAYVENDPVNYVDPFGFNKKDSQRRDTSGLVHIASFGNGESSSKNTGDTLLDAYIKQFYNGKITVTIAAERPVENSRVVVNIAEGDVGHTFIRLDFGNGTVITKGFYPKQGMSLDQILDNSTVAGKDILLLMRFKTLSLVQTVY